MAKPATPTPPAEGTPPAGGTSHPLLGELSQALVKYFGFELDLNFVASALNPELYAQAKKAAEAANRKIKADSFLRTSLASRGLGMLAAALENMGDRQTGTLRALMKKGSDFLEFFGVYFYGHSLKEDARKYGDVEAAERLTAIDERFLERAFELIVATDEGDTSSVVEQLKEKACGLADVREALAHGRQKPPPEPKEPGVPFKERIGTAVKTVDRGIGDFNAALAPGVKWLKADTERLRKEREAKVARAGKGGLGRILDAPWKLVAKLWK